MRFISEPLTFKLYRDEIESLKFGDEPLMFKLDLDEATNNGVTAEHTALLDGYERSFSRFRPPRNQMVAREWRESHEVHKSKGTTKPWHQLVVHDMSQAPEREWDESKALEWAVREHLYFARERNAARDESLDESEMEGPE